MEAMLTHDEAPEKKDTQKEVGRGEQLVVDVHNNSCTYAKHAFLKAYLD